MGEKIKVALCGACGRMGQEVIKAVHNDKALELVAAIDINNLGEDIGNIVLNSPIGVKLEKDLKQAFLLF